MKRGLWEALLLSVATALAAGAQETGSWQNWQYSRPISRVSINEARLVRVTLPMEVFGRAQASQADLRVIDDADNEVPYVIYARRGERTREWRDTQLSEVGFVPGQYTQVVVDTGEKGPLHNSLEIKTDQKDFFMWAEVAASDDKKTWRTVQDRAPIYRFEKDRLAGSQVVSYPNTQARWLRIRTLNGDKQFPVTSCRVAQEVVEEAERVPLPVTPTNDLQSPKQESRWLMDLGVANVPVSATRFEVTQEEFHRPVRINVSTDGKLWRDVGHGDIYRYRTTGKETEENTKRRSSLQVEFGETQGRYWRVTVLNRNDAPAAGLRPELLGTPRHITFRQEAGRSYRLLYGNSRIETPQYDLAKLTKSEDKSGAIIVTLGAEEINTRYASPEPWSERHPVVLWVALGLAVAVLAWLAVRALRSEVKI